LQKNVNEWNWKNKNNNQKNEDQIWYKNEMSMNEIEKKIFQ
jgi:hypothetical protein